MEPPQEASSSPPPADVDVTSQAGLTTITHVGVQSQSNGSDNQRQLRVETDNLQLHQPGTLLLQLGFQDSNLSPALALLPDNTRAQHNFTEYSLFQQSDTDFAPLRPYPDVSNASERFTFLPQDLSINKSLSQHPLDQETILSEEHAHSLSSPSQQKDQSRLEEKVQTPLRSTKVDADSSVTYQKKLVSDFFREAGKDETLFLSKDVSAHQLLALLEKELSLPSTTSSAVSSGSETSIRSTGSLTEEWKTNNIGKLGTSRSMLTREGPSGKASNAQQATQQTDREQIYDPSAEVCNITTGSRNPQPDDSSEALRRELLSEAERHSTDGAEHRKQVPKPPPPADLFDTPYPGEHRSLVGVAYTGPNSTRVEQIQREHDLWSSGNQTGIDGSYLGFIPQSQSTPGVLKAPSKSSAKAKFSQLSDIQSNTQSTNQSSPGTPVQPADLVPDVHHTDSAHQQQEEAAAEVQSLPVLSYMQKVDAWKVNQSSGKPSLFDSLALQGFSGISPKKKAYDAVSDSLNQILSQQARRLQQPLVSSPTTQDLPQSSSKTLSGSSSPRRGEAVGSDPSERENTGSAALESQSSLSTLVVSVHKDQQTDKHPVEQEVKTKDLVSIGHFSDVSPDPVRTFSGSQDSYSGVKNQTSIGASSVVSLEIDNYVPHWTSKLTTSPPRRRPPELNIDERIPVYLHNLGIDQSPSTILTPFAPIGPIREPEFSPTDICTLTGSIATPIESAQASQGNSPHKEDSVLSVNSNTSPPISVDSLGPAVSVSGRTRWTSPPLKLPALESENEVPSYSQSEEDSQSSVLNVSQQLRKSDLDLLVPKTQVKDHSEVHLSQSSDEAGQDSFVGSKAMTELRKLVMQADSLLLTESFSAFSPPQRPHTEDGASVSVKNKTNKLQDSLFSTSLNAGAPSSLLWTSSPSDSMLTSDKQRQGSVGQESLNLDFPPTQAQVPASTAASYQGPIDSGPTGTSLVLSKSVLRTEPEGCSAAPPDKAPNQTSLIQPSQQLSSPVSSADDMVNEEDEDEDDEEEEEEEVTTMPADPAQSVTSSAAVQGDTDQEVMSEGSSQSSLALRVAKLLQDESPATMMSSTPSLTDNERKASEGIKLKISGEQFGPLHLDEKDKSKIEEIKRELLLKNPLKSLPSTDTESSSTSSSRVRSLHGPSSSAETYAAKRPGNVFLSQPQQSPIVDLTETSTQVQTQLQTDLEDIVCEIASREGVRIPTKNPRALTSITIATCRRSASSSPSTSPTALSLTPELLHLTELSSDQPTAAHIQLQSKEERSTQTNGLFGPPLTTEDQNVTSLSAVEGLTRQETVGGQSAPSSQVSDGEHVQIERAQASRNIEKTTQTHQSSSATAGHVSHVHLTLSPKHHQTLTSDLSRSPNVAPRLPRRDFVPPRHSSSRGSSPDEGVGSSSPQEWSDAREPARLQASGRTTMFQSAAPLRTATGMSTIPHRAEKSLRGPAAETPVPLLLPYKPRGSEQLFYVPQTEADVSSTETTMESSHSGSDDAVPPRFSSDVLGHRDPGLDRGVTIRHTEGIYSKRLKTTTFKMQDPPSRDAAVAGDETSSTSVSSEIHQEALSRDQGTSPIPEPASQQSRLDLLWQKFCEQWAAEQSRPTSDREASLLERLERLSRLINRSSAGRLRDRREEDGSEPWSRGGTQHRRTTRNTEVQGNKGLKLRLHKEETSQSTSSSISQSTDTRSSMSTVDTVRLIRAYGAHKVQHLKSSSSLHKLYSIINKQREEEESRSNDDIIAIAPSESTNKSAVVDSTSSTSEVPAHRGPSRMLTAKRAVNKSIQAGDLELVSNGTRRHTRDVGTTFPSPATSRASEQSSTPPSSVTRGRGARRSPSKSQSVHRQRKNKRSPGKAYPAGVSWFIRADYLRSDARKENREEDEDPPTHTMNGAWFELYRPVGSWREPLRQKQIHQDINEQHHTHHHHHHHHHPPDQRTKPVSTGLSPVSLQEALETQRPDFILHSRQRLKRLALRAEERRQQMPFSLLEREQLLLHRMGGWERLPKPAGCDSLRRAVPRKEMIQRSKQIYENLPEVQRRREEEKRKAEYRSNRLNAQLYNKRITNRVLGKKLAWH